MSRKFPDQPDKRFQHAPTEKSSGDLRSFLSEIGHRRPEMVEPIKAFLQTHNSLFEKVDRLTVINPANSVRILNTFWSLITEKNLPIREALEELDKFIDGLVEKQM